MMTDKNRPQEREPSDEKSCTICKWRHTKYEYKCESCIKYSNYEVDFDEQEQDYWNKQAEGEMMENNYHELPE